MSHSHSSDVEKDAGTDYAHLTNDAIHSFSWQNVTVTVKGRHTKQPKDILSNASGIVRAGEMMALMGPSGSGKTTLLNVLAHRQTSSGASTQQNLCINGQETWLKTFQKLSAYVEQEDALVGSLTVRETLHFAAQLSLPSSVTKAERIARIDGLLKAFGLQEQSHTLIGTPIRKGVSGGQKRRVSVAAQLITSPKILFLDEPTSGLDSAASFEVMSFVRNIAKEHRILVIASIHQPSTTTFDLFDKLMFLSGGKVTYNGSVPDVKDYFASLGYHMPLYTNPAEYILQLVNTDFSRDALKSKQQLQHLHTSWAVSSRARDLAAQIHNQPCTAVSALPPSTISSSSPNPLLLPLTLLHRSLVKAHRDLIAYYLRIAMYLALALLMGTIWLRLPAHQSSIQALTNALFFGGAFMSFMAVAYIPAFLEDLALYTKERQNGLYGPTSFVVANLLVGVPYLFVIALLFSLVVYWLVGFRTSSSSDNSTATPFLTFTLWLFLDLLAAESLVVLLSSLLPVFVLALAATAFANGLWMCVNGFMVPPAQLNPFWRYAFHYIDYQAYVFRGMMVNEFSEGRSFECQRLQSGACECMYPSALQEECRIGGEAVLAAYGYETGGMGKWVGYMLLIVLGYRVLGWGALWFRRR